MNRFTSSIVLFTLLSFSIALPLSQWDISLDEKCQIQIKSSNNIINLFSSLQSGRGEIDLKNLMIDGNLQFFPKETLISSDITCKISSQQQSLEIVGEVITPMNNLKSQTTSYKIQFSIHQEDILKFNIQLGSSKNDTDFIQFNLSSDKEEEFYGMGLQYTVWNLKKLRVYVITSEGGVGRGLQPLTYILNKFDKSSGGNPLTSYGATYSYISSKNYGIIFNTTAIGHVDFENDNSTNFLFWNVNQVEGYLFVGETPKKLVSLLTSIIGRMNELPEWISNGVIAALQGGEQVIKKNYDILKKNGVPLVGIWMQDWVGTKKFVEGTRLLWNWKLNRNQYPNWDQMIDDWKQDGVKPLIYINPYFANLSDVNLTRNLFQEGDSNGYFVKNQQNTTYLIQSISIQFAMVDFTNPEAVIWLKNIIKDNLIKEAKAFGWMQDFGEYAPFDVVTYSKEDPTIFHNAYPLRWAQTMREAKEEVGELGNEIVSFMRSASTMSPKYTDLFWMGDQLTTYDQYDGLQSALIGMLNSGISGFTLTHSDIGGYTAFKKYGIKITRNKELLQRWIEMNTFSDAIMRTHISNLPEDDYQVYSDDQIAQFFAYFGKIHQKLASYKRNLIKLANTQGLPLIRALLLQYPSDSIARQVCDQFMLGDDILMAPIFQKGLINRQVYLPKGKWQKLWTGEKIDLDMGTYFDMKCNIGAPCVFVNRDNKELLQSLELFINLQQMI